LSIPYGDRIVVL
jgi:hypothetical protein